MMTEFKKFPKITRVDPFDVTISEKMDGTNGCIIIEDGVIVGVQSRNRLITIDDDNYGFAQWVEDNSKELLKLGNGYHYGEWCGEGIMKNRHKLEGKKFFLFNMSRWQDDEERPFCCDVVPYINDHSDITSSKIAHVLVHLAHVGGYVRTNKIFPSPPFYDWVEKNKNFYQPEGIIIYWHAFGKYTKHTYENTQGKWQND